MSKTITCIIIFSVRNQNLIIQNLNNNTAHAHAMDTRPSFLLHLPCPSTRSLGTRLSQLGLLDVAVQLVYTKTTKFHIHTMHFSINMHMALTQVH